MELNFYWANKPPQLTNAIKRTVLFFLYFFLLETELLVFAPEMKRNHASADGFVSGQQRNGSWIDTTVEWQHERSPC